MKTSLLCNPHFTFSHIPSRSSYNTFSAYRCLSRRGHRFFPLSCARSPASPALIPLSPYSTTLRQPLSAPENHKRYRDVARLRHFSRPDLTSTNRTCPRYSCVGKQTQLKSSLSSALYIAPLVAVAVAFVLYEALVPGRTDTAEQAPYIELLEDLKEMEALPGRPGNLTPEQEEKLRRFWEVFLQVCGVVSAEDATEVPASADQGKSGTPEKAKKKRHISLFKKKDKKDKDSASEKFTASSETTKTAAAAEDDKWGETRAYQEVLAKHPPEAIRSTIWAMVKHDDPDGLMLRFLRARKWDVQKALTMLLATMNWRASEAHVDDDIMIHGEAFAAEQEKSSDEATKKAGEDFLAQLRMGKSFIHGVDKAGRLICICRAALHKASEQSEESLERYTIYLIETCRLMLQPPADTACIIFDMTGFSLANMDYAPVKFMIRCFEANYPESLGVVLVHKAPWVFQGIWKVIRGWLDPVVASKVNFTNNVKDLEEFIAPDKILKELEGGEDWTYQYVEPVPGENDRMKDTATRDRLLREREASYEEYEQRTVEWINEADVEKRAAIQAARNAIAKKMDDQYWQLDPYIRARSLYDRLGIIKPNGEVDYYPPTSKATTAPTTNGTAAPGQTSADDVD